MSKSCQNDVIVKSVQKCYDDTILKYFFLKIFLKPYWDLSITSFILWYSSLEALHKSLTTYGVLAQYLEHSLFKREVNGGSPLYPANTTSILPRSLNAYDTSSVGVFLLINFKNEGD